MKIQFERSQLEKIQEKFSETMKQIADDQNKVEDLKLQLARLYDLFFENDAIFWPTTICIFECIT